jgi:hypothetical protein
MDFIEGDLVVMKTVILLGTAHRVQGAERGICNIKDPDYETLPRCATGGLVACTQECGANKRKQTNATEMILRISAELRCAARHPSTGRSSRLLHQG